MTKITRKPNPMEQRKVWWVWVFLLPVALLLWAFFTDKESRRVKKIKRERKCEKKKRFEREHWEYDWWMDDQGL